MWAGGKRSDRLSGLNTLSVNDLNIVRKLRLYRPQTQIKGYLTLVLGPCYRASQGLALLAAERTN